MLASPEGFRPDPATPAMSAVGLGALAPPLVGILSLLALQGLAPLLGLAWDFRITLLLTAGVVAVELWPTHAFSVAALTGLAVLWRWAPLRFTGYEGLLVLLTFAARKNAWSLAAVVCAGVIVVPKELFRRHYHQPFLHDWVNPFMLAQLALVVAMWWRERPKVGEGTLPAWSLLFLFPAHALNALNIPPSLLWRPRAVSGRATLHALGLVAIKAAAVFALTRWLPWARLSAHTPAELASMGLARLWTAIAGSYLLCALTLSATADIAVAIGRAFGWPLPFSFRFALLAWNPVELWRRWATYNRRLLLSLVYFPLGGNTRRRYLNVMLTFAASGLLLHSGWLGSRYWELGIAGWRDQTVYFLVQGLMVCACLAWWQVRGKDAASDRTLRLSWGRVLATVAMQAATAWVHILVLAPHVAWADRWRLMMTALGG